jgi:hypothetical protein
VTRLAPIVRRDTANALPGWLADPELVARLAEDRATHEFPAEFWTFLAGLADTLGSLAGRVAFDREQATTALRMACAVADRLPVPLRRAARDEGLLLTALPPFAPLGPGGPFSKAVVAYARSLGSSLLRATNPEHLAYAVYGVLTLLRVYCLAASASESPARLAPDARHR